MERETPHTDHDLLVRIWTILEGTNGSGLITRFACIETTVTEIKAVIPTLWTKEEHITTAKQLAEAQVKLRNRRKITTREWVLGSAVVLVPVLTLVIAHYWH